ncbi:MAG: preprotein translocase subunit SecY [Acidimicrobiia bacterium]
MFSRLRNMFRVPDLRKKILFTICVIALFRFGTYLPLPYIDLSTVKQISDQATQNGVVGLLNLFSGGGLLHGAVFALGIMPYITASIIMQLLTVAIPKLEQWQQEGQTGQKKITQWTRYVTLVLALVQSVGLTIAWSRGGNFLGTQLNSIFLGQLNIWRGALVVVSLVAGTALVMWFSELITQRGIGNGMSLLIFTSVVSQLPAQLVGVWQEGTKLQFFVIIGVGLAMIVGVVFVESGQRRIPVQFAKRVVGRRMYGGQSTFIPLKVNQAGVVPVIFASTLLQFPAVIAQITPWTGFQKWVDTHLVQGTGWIYISLFTLLIIFFTYFYNAIAFNPQQQADIIRKQGGFIPGIRPGPPTERYLARILNRITLPGAIFLAIIALVPLLVIAIWNIKNFPFGGTSLLITVGVALETMKQIDSQLTLRNYEGFLATP